MRRLAGATAFSLAVFAGSVQALSLGQLQLNSGLNQPLDAEITLADIQAAEADGMSVTLASREAFLRAGIDRPSALNDLKFTMGRRANGQPYIKVLSSAPIQEPFLNFLVEVDWSRGSLVREYTVLLDPPVFLADRPEASGQTDGVNVVSQASAFDQNPSLPQPILRSANNNDAIVGIDDLPPLPQVNFSGGANDSAEALVAAAFNEQPLPSSTSQVIAPEAAQLVEASLVEGDIGDAISGVFDQALPAASEAKPKTSNAGSVSRSASTGSKQVKVGSGDTLWGIANGNKPSGTSTQQAMVALLRANKSAFVNGNMNRLRKGAILRMPPREEVLSLSSKDVASVISSQSSSWKTYQKGVQQRPTQSSGGVSTGSSNSGTAVASASTELKLLAPEKSGSAKADAATSVKNNDALNQKAQSDLQAKLSLTTEELVNERAKTNELQDRVKELEGIVDQLTSAVNLRSDSMADLQKKLSDEGQKAGVAVTDLATDALDGAQNAAAGALDAAGDVASGANELAGGVGDIAANGVEAGVSAIGTATEGVVDSIDNVVSTGVEQLPVTVMPEVSAPWWEEYLSMLPYAGVGILVLGGVGYLVGRRRDDEEEIDFDEMEDTHFDDMAPVASASQDDDTLASAIGDAFDKEDLTDAQSVSSSLDADDSLANLTSDTNFGVTSDNEFGTEAQDLSKDDTLSEADVYMSYNLFDRAEELLEEASTKQPDRHQYQVKLLEALAGKGDSAKFASVAESYHQRFGGDSAPEWDRIAVIGQEISPDHRLFGGMGVAASVASEDVISSELDFGSDDDSSLFMDATDVVEVEAAEEDPGLDFESSFLSSDTTDEASSSVLGAAAVAGTAVAADLGSTAGDMADSVSDFFTADGSIDELTLDSESVSSSESNLNDEPLDFSSGFDMTDDKEESELLSSISDIADTVSESDSDGTIDPGLEFDMSEIESTLADLDGTEVKLDQTDTPELSLAGSDNHDFTGDLDFTMMSSGDDNDGLSDDNTMSFETSGDEMDTMLDLARAYIDMGDSDSASGALQEIINGGNEEQRNRANEMLQEIG